MSASSNKIYGSQPNGETLKNKLNPETITSLQYSEQMQVRKQDSSSQTRTQIIQSCNPLDQLHIIPRDFAKSDSVNATEAQQIGTGITKIYADLFGQEALDESLAEIQKEHFTVGKMKKRLDAHMAECITNEIVRLQQIEEDYLKFNKMLERNVKNGSNEEKWKIIVLSYREKLQKYEQSLKQEKRVNALLQKQLNSRIEEVDRLSNMNSIKFQKLNATLTDLQIKTAQTNELNSMVNEMELNLSSMKIKTDKIQQALELAQKQKQNLTAQLHEITYSLQLQRQKSILFEKQRDQDIPTETKVLTLEDEDLRREIDDIKSKYQHQNQQLEARLRDCLIEKEELVLKLMETQHKISFLEQKNDTKQSYSQTEENVVKAVFYNSLEDDLEGEEIPEMEEHHSLQHHEDSHQSSECQFELSIDPRSTNNHRIDTPREFYENYSERDRDNNHYSNLDASFDEGNSLSNAPSRYMDTLEQLTAELAEAYQRINELTQKINTLQDENKKLKAKIVPPPMQKSGGKFGGGLFNSFFKK